MSSPTKKISSSAPSASTTSLRPRRRTASSKSSQIANPKDLSARERLLSTARRLFYREGPRAVGIDRVIAESGVAKMSLYRYFRSKDELIVACLVEHDREYWQLWDATISVEAATSVARLRNAVCFIAHRTSEPSYLGCIFLNTAQSFPELAHPAHQVAVAHKQALSSRLRKLCDEAGAANAQTLSRQLILLINGAQATAGMLGRETQIAIIGAADSLLRAQGIRVIDRSKRL